jgi:hypothetical protein
MTMAIRAIRGRVQPFASYVSAPPLPLGSLARTLDLGVRSTVGRRVRSVHGAARRRDGATGRWQQRAARWSIELRRVERCRRGERRCGKRRRGYVLSASRRQHWLHAGRSSRDRDLRQLRSLSADLQHPRRLGSAVLPRIAGRLRAEYDGATVLRGRWNTDGNLHADLHMDSRRLSPLRLHADSDRKAALWLVRYAVACLPGDRRRMEVDALFGMHGREGLRARASPARKLRQVWNALSRLQPAMRLGKLAGL